MTVGTCKKLVGKDLLLIVIRRQLLLTWPETLRKKQIMDRLLCIEKIIARFGRNTLTAMTRSLLLGDVA